MSTRSRTRSIIRSTSVAIALIMTVSSRALAEGEAQAQADQQQQQQQQQPPSADQQPQGDAWDQAVRQGMHQEGRLTKDQVADLEKAEQAEIDAHEALRKTVRPCLFIGGGGGIGLPHTLENQVEVAAGGAEFQIGAGIRKGISLSWEFQGRGLFTLIEANRDYGYYSPFGSATFVDSTAGNTGLGVSFDGTARYHFGGLTKPFYFGFGGRFDFISLSAERTTNTRVGSFTLSEAKTTTTLLTFAPLGLLEGGIVLMDSQRVDLSVRVAAGLGFHAGAMVGVAF